MIQTSRSNKGVINLRWRDVVGYEGIYEVSDTGLVRSHQDKTTYSDRHGLRKWNQRILKQKVSMKDKCCRVILYKDKKPKTFLVHRLIAMAFLKKPEGKDYINHIDGNRLNNNLDNLEWCNHKENNNHAFDNGLIKTADEVVLFNPEKSEFIHFRSKAKASEFLDRSHNYISDLIKKGKSEYQGYKIFTKG
jgi:hypothetical protein